MAPDRFLTHESPISDEWKTRLLELKSGDVALHKFSPTGFYSSAVRNDFLSDLYARSERQVPYSRKPTDILSEPVPIGRRGRPIHVTPQDKPRVENWLAQGFTEGLATPDDTMIFVATDQALTIKQDQIDCMGCLSQCAFSNWHEKDGSTGKKADPRSFCIQKTLQSIAHQGAVDNELMFAGHNAYHFATDPFYQDGRIPTVGELIERIKTGD